MERTITAQEDSAEVERVRAEQGDVAAAAAEAQLSFLRQNPLLVYDQVDALAAALGITKQLTDQDRERLQVLIEQGNAAEAGAVAAARTKAQEQQDREAARQEKEAQRAADRQAEYFQRAQEIAILDIADLYQTAMRGGVDDLWDHFKDEGIRIIAEIAATWTLSMLSGNPFNAGMAAQGEQARSPLSSIFFGSGFGGAANDNGFGGIVGAGGPRNVVSGDLPTGGVLAGVGANTPVDATLRGGAGNLQQIGAGLALSQLGIGIGGNSGTFGQIGGMAGGLGGMALGKTIGALGGVGGPVGAVVGSLLGNIVGGLFSSTSRGSAIIGNSGGSLGVTGFFGNSASRKDAAAGSAGSLIDAIYQIADQLGGGVDASRGRVSIGVRNDSINVDPQGRGFTKTSKFADIRAFGQDEEAAIEFAIRDLISDGVLTGISQVSQNLLNRPGTDLETQIEKALLIEQVPRLLKQRLDPLGAALDEVYDKFKLLADALKEGGASAEEVAQAQRLYELEKAEAIASIGAASQTLKDFLDSLNAGSNSPLSLRQQRTEAEAQLAPFLEQIAEAEAARAEVDRLKSEGGSAEAIAAAETAARTAAAAIDQSAFTDASQLLLSISRQANASTSSFFSDFDRIRALTGQAIGFVDAATPTAGDGRDPFSAEIAKNTADAAYIQSEHTVILRNIEALLAAGAANNNGSGGGFIGEARAFAR